MSDAEQERRFRDRLKDPLKQWKLSPMDLESLTRWEEYSRAKDDMFAATDNPDIPWMVVESEDKRRARLNTIAHLLSSVPWQPVERRELHLPKRPKPTGLRPAAAGAVPRGARPRRDARRKGAQPREAA